MERAGRRNWSKWKVKQPQRCAICDARGGGLKLEVDHVTPLFLGGDDAESNLQLLCWRCHKNKTTRDRASKEPRRQITRKLTQAELQAFPGWQGDLAQYVGVTVHIESDGTTLEESEWYGGDGVWVAICDATIQTGGWLFGVGGVRKREGFAVWSPFRPMPTCEACILLWDGHPSGRMNLPPEDTKRQSPP